MDFSAMFKTWMNAVTQPNEEFWENERQSPNATLGTALIWIVIAAVISGLLGALAFMAGMSGMGAAGGMDELLSDPNLPPEAIAIFEAMFSPQGLTSLVIASVILTPIFWLIFTGILHLVARLLGGKGEFGRFAYLNAAYYAPITIVSGLAGLGGAIGGCVSLLLTIYAAVLAYFTIKTEHGLSQGKSIMAIVIMVVVPFALIICAVVGMAVVMAGAMTQ